jgi:hypothetical protein
MSFQSIGNIATQSQSWSKQVFRSFATLEISRNACRRNSDHDTTCSKMQPNKVVELVKRCCQRNDLQQTATNKTEDVSEGKQNMNNNAQTGGVIDRALNSEDRYLCSPNFGSDKSLSLSSLLIHNTEEG